MCECKYDCKPVSEKNSNFQVGDVVEWCGTKGVVKEVLHPDYPFPIVCMFDGRTTKFLEDGRYLPWHTKPSLTLVSRPQRKVKKTITRWVNVHPKWVSPGEASKLKADKCALKGRIVCVELTGTYEVEE